MIKNLCHRILSLLLIIAIVTSFFSGCAQINNQTTNPTVNTEAIAGEIIDNLTAEALTLSFEWEDYVGDIETFVYGLIVHQLEYQYSVFPGCVTLSDGNEIYGLAYSNYSECYTNEEETTAYFAAGFLPFSGEDPVPQKEFDQGLIITNLDFDSEDYIFFLKYGGDPLQQHCVVFDQYVIYGVDDQGCIFYSATPYEHGVCDETIGALYSYDDGRYLLDTGLGNYVVLSGVSLSSEIDFAELEQLINECLEKQDLNFVQADIISNLCFAQESVTSYLLSLQEETFLGYSVASLVEIANDLKPEECLRITDEGIAVIEIDAQPKNGATPLVKWLIGSVCVVITTIGLVASVVTIECPILSSRMGAVTGIAIDVFMQVVIDGQGLNDINWGKVALSAVSGAVSGFLGPYMSAISNGAIGFLADSTIDAIIGGIENTVVAWMDGATGQDLIKSFGYGAVLGFALSSAFKVIGKVATTLAKKLSNCIEPLERKFFPNLTSKVSKFTSDIPEFFLNLKKQVDDTPFHSEYVATKLATNLRAQLGHAPDKKLRKKAIRHLTNLDMIDADGNKITKESLDTLLDSADEGAIIAYVNTDYGKVKIINKSGLPDVVFEGQAVVLDRLVDNRTANFTKAAAKLKEKWLADPSLIPPSIKNAIDETGIDLANMTPERLRSILRNRKNGFVLHESIDMKTITLVAIEAHDLVKHMGGYAAAKYVKAHMSIVYFDRLLTAASTGMVEGTS